VQGGGVLRVRDVELDSLRKRLFRGHEGVRQGRIKGKG
jgi:hypothetical protein